MITLNNLHFWPGSKKKAKRVCRGNSGKSAGRGEKGQKARSGVSLGNFQGGQTPLHRRIPKYGSFHAKLNKIKGISLSLLEPFFESGFLKDTDWVTSSLLVKLKIIKLKDKYKLIGSTEKSMKVEAHAFSEGAKESIEKHNGEIKILEKR